MTDESSGEAVEAMMKLQAEAPDIPMRIRPVEDDINEMALIPRTHPEKLASASEWVAQAICLCRSATCRPERTAIDRRTSLINMHKGSLDIPPGQWPGGTAKLPVPPKAMKYSS